MDVIARRPEYRIQNALKKINFGSEIDYEEPTRVESTDEAHWIRKGQLNLGRVQCYRVSRGQN